MKNNSFEDIGEQLEAAATVLLYIHVNMDGDCLGSAAAMCAVLRRMGKDCYILLEDELHDNLKFLDKGYCTYDQQVIAAPDVSMCIDCGDPGRFPKRADKFAEGRVSICVDHHGTTEPFCQYNYIDPDAAATGELIYKLIMAMDQEINKEIGEALFAAITTDTGNFQYSNTTRESHEIVAALYDAGIDSNAVSVEIYETVRVEKLMIKKKILDTLELLADGRLAMAYVSQAMLAETGALMEETEGSVAELRSIDRVEVAVFLKEEAGGTVYVSFRSKHDADVAEVAARLGGGGHKKAAGCTLYDTTLAAAYETVRDAVMEIFE